LSSSQPGLQNPVSKTPKQYQNWWTPDKYGLNNNVPMLHELRWIYDNKVRCVYGRQSMIYKIYFSVDLKYSKS
jgi:hypothetical protein